MSSSSRHVDFSLTVNPIPSPTLTSSILLNLSFSSSRQIIDLQTRHALLSSSPSRSSKFQFKFNPRLVDSPALLSQRLHGFLVRRRDLDPQSRLNLAAEIGHSISQQRLPLKQVDVDVRIVHSEFVNPATPARVIDGAYVIDASDVGRGKGSQLTAKELIKTRSFDCGIEMEQQECSICFDNFIKHKRAVKTECNHVFHPNCISKWLRKNNTCPLCRKRVL